MTGADAPATGHPALDLLGMHCRRAVTADRGVGPAARMIHRGATMLGIGPLNVAALDGAGMARHRLTVALMGPVNTRTHRRHGNFAVGRLDYHAGTGAATFFFLEQSLFLAVAFGVVNPAQAGA